MHRTTKKRLRQIESVIAERQRESDPANDPIMQLSPADQALVRRKIEADERGETIEQTPEYLAARRRYLFVLRDRAIEEEKRMTPKERKELLDRTITILHSGRQRVAQCPRESREKEESSASGRPRRGTGSTPRRPSKKGGGAARKLRALREAIAAMDTVGGPCARLANRSCKPGLRRTGKESGQEDGTSGGQVEPACH
jgi:hypothetical protein